MTRKNQVRLCPPISHNTPTVVAGVPTKSGGQSQSCKNQHGFETYKFFQNWLRVPALGPGLLIYCPGGAKTRMGNTLFSLPRFRKNRNYKETKSKTDFTRGDPVTHKKQSQILTVLNGKISARKNTRGNRPQKSQLQRIQEGSEKIVKKKAGQKKTKANDAAALTHPKIK